MARPETVDRFAPKPWKEVIARWPKELRDFWADWADAFEAGGLSVREAEAMAFLLLHDPTKDAPPPACPPVPDYPWRLALERWPDDRRAAWGRRANELAEAGVPFPEDERQAFAELTAAMAATPAGPRGREATPSLLPGEGPC